jgi:TonB-linked SusC/RagA family outer membrane protein
MIGKPSSLKCLMAFFMLLNCTYLIAQERVVTGKVKDPSGNPLPGVNVNVWGTRISVTADVTGTFRLPVPSENSVLVFSFVGFLQKEQKVGSDSTFNISMAYDNADLDQVVVVGYGTTKRRDLTGSVYSVKPGMVTATPVTNAGEALQGRIPGLDITRTNGAPGGGVSIQLRGNRTLNGVTEKGATAGSSSEPLVIIDGFQGGSLSDLNPNDIESIEVMKDASSTAIYGWQGANGVIIVTTKRGKDRPKVSYNGFYGVNAFAKYPKVRMGQDFVNFRKEAWRGANPDRTDIPADESFLDRYELPYYQAGQWTDWLDLITQNGTHQSHTASIQSGGDKTKVFFSTGVYSEEGMLRMTNSTRYNARLNYDQRISNMFKAGFMTQVTYQNTNGRKDPLAQVSSFVPFGDPYDGDGNIKLWPFLPMDSNYKDNGRNKNLLSPLTDERKDASKDNTTRGNLIANAYLEITPITGLSLRSNLGTTLGYSRRGEFYDSVSLQNYTTPNNNNTARLTNGFSSFYSWDNIITYTRRLADHNVTLTGITSLTQSINEESGSYGIKVLMPSYQWYDMSATQTSSRQTTSDYTKTSTFSYAGRLNYTYKGKYLLTATVRADGVSRLSADKKWDYFPSAGIGWNIHQEEFMSGAYFVNNLKLRATYGVAGNASVPAYGTQSGVVTQTAVIGSTPVTVSNFKETAGNLNVGWEKTATANLGLDFALFKSRVYGTIDVYKAKTTDILFRRPLPPSSGFANMWQNLGTSENEGIEAALTTVNMNKGNFRWTTTVTFTMAREKLTSLITDKDITDKENNSLLNGYPVKSWWGYKKIGIWQEGENKDSAMKNGNYTYVPGDIKVEDRDGNGVIDINDRGFVGADVPKWFGGLQNTFTYKGLELSVYLVARYGQIINAEFIAGRYNVGGGGNGLADLDYWTPENPTNDMPRPRAGRTYNDPGYTGSYSLNFIDGSFWKLKTVTLAYTLPAQISRRVFTDRVRIYATGNNILTQAKNKLLKSYDPERGGSENSPLTRQFVFGANIDF